jgi:hypothetical protein
MTTMNAPRPLRVLAPVALLLAIGAAPACTDTRAPAPAAPAPQAPPAGSIQIALQVPAAVSIDSLSYQIARGSFAKSGTIGVAQDRTISAVVGGLPAGTGYQLSLTATDPTHALAGCAGAATFDVAGGAVTPVPVEVTCHLAPPPPPPMVPIPLPAVVALAGALMGAGLLASGRAGRRR